MDLEDVLDELWPPEDEDDEDSDYKPADGSKTSDLHEDETASETMIEVLDHTSDVTDDEDLDRLVENEDGISSY